MKETNIIANWVPSEARVLDLGCGDGELLAHLTKSMGINGYGLEISPECIAECISKGVSVIEQNFDEGLANFPADSFDVVLLTSTLQAARRPDVLIREMLRIGKQAIITFPNFSYWRHRAYLLLRGTMPVSKLLPYQWYSTPNIHLCSIHDFEKLCRDHALRIVDKHIEGGYGERYVAKISPNFWGKHAMYLVQSE